MSRLASILPILIGLAAGRTAHAGEIESFGNAVEAAPASPAARNDLAEPADVPAGARGAESNPEFRASARLTAYREHAPLAYFSLGSLAVGGLFYGIQTSLDRDGRSRINGDGTRMDMAVGAAGITALAAGAAYLYYVLRGKEIGDEPSSPWAGPVRGGVGPDGKLAASVTLPLSSLSP
jgi:hypothetical protein